MASKFRSIQVVLGTDNDVSIILTLEGPQEVVTIRRKQDLFLKICDL